MHDTDFLEQVQQLVAQLEKGLPKASVPVVQEASGVSIQLELPMPYKEQCLASLSAYNLADDRKTALSLVYHEHICSLGRAYHTRYSDAVTGLRHMGETDGSFFEAFKTSLQHSKANRGHDSDAVRILEQAFQHTPNITQAEKYRLAEVTGLQPKQVTIWFQNRRNRKGRKGAKAAKNSHARVTARAQSPNDCFSPPRDFTLNEKKRKSYGALGVASSSSSDSDSDEGFLKKPRLPRAHSGLSDASTSSSAHTASFIAWSSPSSRSTSSSSVSSSPSDCFDSPGKAHNVFRLLNPLKYDARAKQDMPAVTMATPSLVPYHRAEDRSPFSSDVANGGVYGGAQKLQFARKAMQHEMDFGGLQFDADAMGKDLCESVQRVLEMNFSSLADRSVSDSSWGSVMQGATDDDGWVDDDEPGVSTTPSDNVLPQQATAAAQPQTAPGVMQFGNEAAATSPSIHSAAATTAPWTTQACAVYNGNMGGNNVLSGSNDEPILHHFFEPATHAPAPPSYAPYQQTSPQQPIPAASTTPIANANAFLDFEVEMADLDDLLSSFVQPAVPAPNAAAEVGAGAQVAQQQPAEFYLNFDLSPQMFRAA
ncbi:uncharacterized protein PAN0_001c0279 [Moesziomyces antarcticus]|uniref:uncharacterized protein n=1 Tax=Pseudozyma antarctica TaxID=84753 RepID=UPI00071978E4|nr:uncharacterized protein PAN0_001c0279 [Moesziomyces antarcticus]GAK62082.1 conserved hypothetical protein [Moesziomyces antarcticus]